jgi:hypothetical protein
VKKLRYVKNPGFLGLNELSSCLSINMFYAWVNPEKPSYSPIVLLLEQK